jgi:hypothetical protein
MNKMRLYTIRLALGIGVVGVIALACTALLDTNSLNTIKREAGTTDAKIEGVKPPDGPKPPKDLGPCKPGNPCQAPSGVGACKAGTLTCYETTSVCKPGTPGPQESDKCDGVDSDCDSVSDVEEAAAKAQCKAAGQYCNGTACVAGCYDNTMCTNGNNCQLATHKCMCGAGSACYGKFKCLIGMNACVCGVSNLSCGSGESCDDVGNACVCGDTKSTTGKACPAGTSCKGTPPTCKAIVDGGPDQRLPDQRLHDQRPPDKPPVDLPPVVVDKPPPTPEVGLE